MNVAMIGHGCVEGTNLLGGFGGMHPKNKDEILDPQIAGNAHITYNLNLFITDLTMHPPVYGPGF